MRQSCALAHVIYNCVEVGGDAKDGRWGLPMINAFLGRTCAMLSSHDTIEDASPAEACCALVTT